jgi:hypothetical protein
MPTHLELLASRVESDPFFLGCLLKGYARSEELDDTALAASLGCNSETLTMLRLCRTPDLDRFNEDINQIVARFGVDRDVLTLAVRRGQAIVAMARQPMGETGGMLLAARDDDRPPTEPQDEEKLP